MAPIQDPQSGCGDSLILDWVEPGSAHSGLADCVVWSSIRPHQQLVLGRLSISKGSVTLEDALEDTVVDLAAQLASELASELAAELAANLPELPVQCRHQGRCVQVSATEDVVGGGCKRDFRLIATPEG